ncbi:MAG: hypothetical protein KY432_05065 [Acidobacteria bacterium]|nr:hypothetical protein [Acidobacteriota bacterium]
MNRLAKVFILAVAFSLAGSADAAMFGRKADCGFKIVSYQVTGQAGQTFTYGGKDWTIPAHGTVEILAKKNVDTIVVSHQPVDLGNRKPNAMGVVALNLDEFRQGEETVLTASLR